MKVKKMHSLYLYLGIVVAQYGGYCCILKCIYMKRYFSIPILLLLGTYANAQQGALTSGGGSSSPGGSISYSIGQTIVQSQTMSGGSITVGLQQTYEVVVLTSLPQMEQLQLQCTLYPNPTQNQLLVQLGSFKPDNLTYTLTDYSGKQITTGNLDSQTQELDMHDLPAGVYFLTLSQQSQALKSFKIIKH